MADLHRIVARGEISGDQHQIGLQRLYLRHDAHQPASIHRRAADMHVAQQYRADWPGPLRPAGERNGGAAHNRIGPRIQIAPAEQQERNNRKGGEKEQETAHQATLAGPPADASAMMLAEPLRRDHVPQ